MVFLDTKHPISFPLEDKRVVNEHHVARKIHDATQKKCTHVVHFNEHVISLKQARGIKIVTLVCIRARWPIRPELIPVSLA